jgi:hypothetical protein
MPFSGEMLDTVAYGWIDTGLILSPSLNHHWKSLQFRSRWVFRKALPRIPVFQSKKWDIII